MRHTHDGLIAVSTKIMSSGASSRSASRKATGCPNRALAHSPRKTRRTSAKTSRCNLSNSLMSILVPGFGVPDCLSVVAVALIELLLVMTREHRFRCLEERQIPSAPIVVAVDVLQPKRVNQNAERIACPSAVDGDVIARHSGGKTRFCALRRLRSFFLPIVFRPYRDRYCSLSSVLRAAGCDAVRDDYRRHRERGQTPRTKTHTTSHKTAT